MHKPKLSMYREKDAKFYVAKLEARIEDVELDMWNMHHETAEEISQLASMIRILKEEMNELRETYDNERPRKTRTARTDDAVINVQTDKNTRAQPESQDLVLESVEIQNPDNTPNNPNPGAINTEELTLQKTTVQKKTEFKITQRKQVMQES